MRNRFLYFIIGACLFLIASCVKEPQPIKVTGITLNSTSISLAEGETADLVATVSPKDADNRTVVWSSSNGSVASVSNGKVTALAPGSATITAKTDDGGFTASCSVTVVAKTVDVASVSLSKTELTLTEGDSETITATVTPDNATNKTVSWSSSDAAVASVDGGKITAVKEGTVTITAKAGDKTATCKVTVEKRFIAVESVELDRTEVELVEGESATIVATVKPDDATDKTVTWSSSDSSVAAIDDGKVIASREGSAVITAKAGEKSATCRITVVKKVIPVESVELNKKDLNLTEGNSEILVATVKPDDATDKTVSWTSSNTSVATVSNGTVTAFAAGTATITAKAGDKSATCAVTVTQASSGPEAVDLGLPSGIKWASYNVGATKPEEYGDYFAWGETSTKSKYTWTNYKLRVTGDSDNNVTFSKYNTMSNRGTVDNKKQLELSDDAARANWGGKWRMPTDAEWTELRNNCTWTWTTQNGVYGRKVTSNKNGKSIFLPAAGWCGTDLYNVGSYGYYWSSSLYTSYPYEAWLVLFNSDTVTRIDLRRYRGRSVRPVTD